MTVGMFRRMERDLDRMVQASMPLTVARELAPLTVTLAEALASAPNAQAFTAASRKES